MNIDIEGLLTGLLINREAGNDIANKFIDKIKKALEQQQENNKELQKRIDNKTKCLIRCRKRRDSAEHNEHVSTYKLERIEKIIKGAV